jgi:Ca2+-binding EF-hand superfamily protein
MVDKLSRDQIDQACLILLLLDEYFCFAWKRNLTISSFFQLHTSFQLLDGDGDGRINATDLQRFLATFNSNFSLADLEEFIEVRATHHVELRHE